MKPRIFSCLQYLRLRYTSSYIVTQKRKINQVKNPEAVLSWKSKASRDKVCLHVLMLEVIYLEATVKTSPRNQLGPWPDERQPHTEEYHDTAIQYLGSGFIESGSGPSILGWMPIQIQSGSRVLMTKNCKNLQLIFFSFSEIAIYLSLGLHKRPPSYRRSLSALNREHPALGSWKVKYGFWYGSTTFIN